MNQPNQPDPWTAPHQMNQPQQQQPIQMNQPRGFTPNRPAPRYPQPMNVGAAPQGLRVVITGVEMTFGQLFRLQLRMTIIALLFVFTTFFSLWIIRS